MQWTKDDVKSAATTIGKLGGLLAKLTPTQVDDQIIAIIAKIGDNDQACEAVAAMLNIFFSSMPTPPAPVPHAVGSMEAQFDYGALDFGSRLDRIKEWCAKHGKEFGAIPVWILPLLLSVPWDRVIGYLVSLFSR